MVHLQCTCTSFILYSICEYHVSPSIARLSAQTVDASLKYCIEEKGLEVYAWIMSSHIHLIIGKTGEEKLESILRDLKRHTSKAILKSIEENTQESRKEWILWMFSRAGKKNMILL